MREHIAVYLRGIRDGWEQWAEFNHGWTWKDRPDLNEHYDQGVDVGQALAIVRRIIGR